MSTIAPSSACSNGGKPLRRFPYLSREDLQLLASLEPAAAAVMEREIRAAYLSGLRLRRRERFLQERARRRHRSGRRPTYPPQE